MNGKRWAAIGIATVVLFFSVIIQLVSLFATVSIEESGVNFMDILGTGSDLGTQVERSGNPLEQIAVLRVDGAIISGGGTSIFDTATYNHDLFLESLEVIAADATIRGVVLFVNSPGGGVYESAQIKRRLDYLQENYEIPIYASFGSMAASGGYYISVGADRIFATPETLTASIGVIFSSLNFTGLMERFGVSDMTVTSGDHKDIFSPYRPVTDEEEAIMQSMVDNMQDEFVRIIAEGRGMSEAEVRTFADGRIVDGLQALELGMIDELGEIEDAIDAMKDTIGNQNAQVIRFYDASDTFSSLFGFHLSNLLGGNNNINEQLARALDTNRAPRLMMIYGGR
ncbi:MAG: signal peptide peptidase SppA [Lachnospiraceae bacterium]|nr:signal peptide peptidase SppA [Lachnospiraceae bacterium]